MANEQNLRPGEYKLSQEEAKKGGKASGAARRRKRELREIVEIAFERIVSHDDEGTPIRADEAMVLKQVQAALNGDTNAFKVLRDTAGQMPVQRVETVEIQPEAYERVSKALEDAGQTTN